MFDVLAYFRISRDHDQHTKNVFDSPIYGYEIEKVFKSMRLRDCVLD